MKDLRKVIFMMAALVLLGGTVLAAAVSMTPASKQKTMYLVKNDKIRANPGSGATLANVKKGDSVILIEESGKFSKVKFEKLSVTGWVKSANLTSKKPGNSKTSTNAESIPLAGKGNTRALSVPNTKVPETEETPAEEVNVSEEAVTVEETNAAE